VDIRELLDDHLLACFDRQLAFSDLIGDAGYSVDLQEGSVSFAGGRKLRVGLIGSAAPGPSTWLWAWANPTSYPAPVLEAAKEVRAFGEARRVRELVTPELPLDDTWDATRAGVAAVAASDIEVWMPVEAGGGTQVMLAVHDVPALPPPHPEPTRLGPALTQAIGIGIVTDWPRALRAYARYRGGEVEDRGSAGEDGRELILTPAGGDSGATLELDGLGRVRKLSMTRAAATLAPSPETPETPRRKSVLGHLFSR
jgi:hypothetical protein